jgi:hypothetical protein
MLSGFEPLDSEASSAAACSRHRVWLRVSAPGGRLSGAILRAVGISRGADAAVSLGGHGRTKTNPGIAGALDLGDDFCTVG